MAYHVTEPHPSVRSSSKTAFISSGIGGAGNLKRYNTSALTSGPAATGPASRTYLPAPPTTIYSGRGGAGNIQTQASSRPPFATSFFSSSASSSSSSKKKPRTSSQSSTSGSDEVHCAIFSFDEELRREQRMRDNAARVYHIGRGGAGNAMPTLASTVTKSTSSASASTNSSVSSGSNHLGMMSRISKTFSRS